MTRTDKLLGALSLCRKAGKLAVGFDAVCAAAGKGEAGLVLVAKDTSAPTRARLQRACGAGCKPRELPYTQRELAMVTRKPAGVLAVTDEGLAKLVHGVLPPSA